MPSQEIILSENITIDIERLLQQMSYDRLFLLMDKTTHERCFPLLAGVEALHTSTHIIIGSTDEHKTLDTLAHVWEALSDGGGTRHSLMVNLGGGMVTDLGGFAASTFKRGIPYINIPTTLLSMVDAAVGGKTGINFNGLKNEIGVFAPASHVFLHAGFLKTLDYENLCSGFAEMLKHGLISHPEHWSELLRFDLDRVDYDTLQQLIAGSVAIKEDIVKKDPFEQNIRKALNLGHTVGHAFESLALAEGRPVLHGYAVAWGLICELYLSCRLTGFPKEQMRQTISFIVSHYGSFAFGCKQYETLYTYMTHDKKNTADTINFTLLGDIGDIRINQTAGKEELFNMFDFFRESTGY